MIFIVFFMQVLDSAGHGAGEDMSCLPAWSFHFYIMQERLYQLRRLAGCCKDNGSYLLLFLKYAMLQNLMQLQDIASHLSRSVQPNGTCFQALP
jgi:hypothetical protein